MYSSESEIPLSTIGYHFAALAEADCLTVSEMRPEPGSRGHLYRLTPLGQQLLQLAAGL